MRHDLQIVGMYSDLHARCACGKWEKRNPKWEFSNGNQVREDSWDEYEAHVKEHNPDFVKCWNLIGWHCRIPYANRSHNNLSDGMIFSSSKLAMDYSFIHTIQVYRCKPIMLPSEDPQIDFFLQTIEEKDRRLGVKPFADTI